MNITRIYKKRKLMNHKIIDTLCQVNDQLDDFLTEDNNIALDDFDGRDTIDIYTETRTLIGRLQAFQTVALAKLASGNIVEKVTGYPTADWIAHREGVSTGQAVKQIRQATSLNEHTIVIGNALQGDISMPKAQAIANAISWLPKELTRQQLEQAEQLLLEFAKSATIAQLNRSSATILNQIAPDSDPESVIQRQAILAHKRRYLTIIDNYDGTTSLYGRLSTTKAAPIVKLLKTYAKSIGQSSQDHQIVEDDVPSPSQRLADALVEIAARQMNHDESPFGRCDRPRIIVTTDLRDLEDRAISARLIDHNHRLTPGELRRLCCEAELIPIVLGGPSEILDVGRARRLATPGMKIALAQRDQGCVFPGCSRTPDECDAHHIKPWAMRGETKLENLVLLCPTHHQLVEPHDNEPPTERWRVAIDGDGIPVFQKPGRVNTPPIRHERFQTVAHAQSTTTDPPKAG